MGGSASLVIPAPYTGMSSRSAHLRRNPPSSEPGTDYYMPIGTPLYLPTFCRVVQVGGSVDDATGRFMTFDDGYRWIRALHLLEIWLEVGTYADSSTIFGLSGASGYGSDFFGANSMDDFPWGNTGGPHVHMTAFKGRRYTWGASGTDDFHALTGGQVASGGNTYVPPSAPPFVPYFKRPYARREKTMFAYQVIDGAGKLGPVGKQRFYLIGGSYFEDMTDNPTANDVSVIANGYDTTGTPMDSPNLTYRELYRKAKASCALTPAELEPYRLAAL